MQYGKYTLEQYRPDFWLISDGHVREFLMVGEEDALLVDTGFGKGDLLELIRQITHKTIRVVLTHGDRDHAGGVGSFPCAHCHPAEFAMLANAHLDTPLKPVWEHDELRCGGYCLEAIHIPGHTPGSIALFERSKRFMITGDSISKGPIFMMGEHRNMTALIASLNKLARMDLQDVEMLPSHYDCPLPSEYVRYTLDSAMKVLDGTVHGEPAPAVFGDACKLYTQDGVQFYY